VQDFAPTESDGKGAPEQSCQQRGGASIREAEMRIDHLIAEKPAQTPRGHNQLQE
jgi:hypothetical protein